MSIAEIVGFWKWLTEDRFVSIKEIQQSPTKTLTGIKIVTNNGKFTGVFMSKEEWEDLMEDMEAMNSASYKKSIAEARKEKRYSREDVIKDLNIKI